MITVMVSGASGKMGRESVKAIHADKDLSIIGGIDPKQAGKDVGLVAGIEELHKSVYASIEEALAKEKPQVIVDFTSPAVIFENAKKVLSAGVHMVIGTTGLTADQRSEGDRPRARLQQPESTNGSGDEQGRNREDRKSANAYPAAGEVPGEVQVLQTAHRADGLAVRG